MFGISIEHWLVLLAAGFFILGPQRLPEAAAWMGRTARQIREYVSGAREHIRSELGPEFDELRQPLGDLNSLRQMNPKMMVGKYLLDEPGSAPAGSNGSSVQGATATPPQPSQLSQPSQPSQVDQSSAPNGRPPVDPDAT